MNEEAVLLVVENVKGDGGFAITQKREIPVFVREKGIVRSEFYEALRSNIQVRLVLELRTEDWELSAHMAGDRREYATQVLFGGVLYNIVRTYPVNQYFTEIVCS